MEADGDGPVAELDRVALQAAEVDGLVAFVPDLLGVGLVEAGEVSAEAEAEGADLGGGAGGFVEVGPVEGDGARLDLADLYRAGGRYWYEGGWNWRAVVAFVAGGVLAVGGASFKPLIDGRPVPALADLADYGWAVGLGTSMVLYLLLMALRGRKAL